MSNTITLTQEQVNVINTALTTLAKVFQNQQTNTLSKPTSQTWKSASTTTVSACTLEQYDWKPLRKWCMDRELDIDKETINGMTINSYPAQAWFEVYGIVLGHFDI